MVKSVGKILGALDYEKNRAVFLKAIPFLLENVKPSVCLALPPCHSDANRI